MKSKKNLTHEISEVMTSSNGKMITFWHNDDKKRYVNVPICPICGGHDPRGRLTMSECDGHSGIKDMLRPTFVKNK